MAAEEPQDSAGPSSPPPPLPEGWLAQWEGVSRKWYYVQRATGKSQWDVPTEPVILTPSTTPGSVGTGPTQAPGAGSQSLDSQIMAADSPDMNASRGLFSSSTGRPILSGVLNSHGSSGITQIADRMLSRISKEFLPSKHNNNGPQQSSYGSGSNTLQPQSGHNPYGYSSTGQSGNYTGNAPQYHPQGQAASQQGEVSQHTGPQNTSFSSAGPSGYTQYHTSDHSGIPHQFPAMNPASQPWQAQNSFGQNESPAYKPQMGQGTINGSAMNMPGQPEWQAGSRPAVSHPTKPTMNHLSQPHLNDQMGIPNQTQPPSDYQSPYHQQTSQVPGQTVHNTYPHGQMNSGYPHHPEGVHGPQSSVGATQYNQQQPPNDFQQNMQYTSFQGLQHPSPYNHSSGMASAPPPPGSNYQSSMSTTPVSVAMTSNGSQQSNMSHHMNPAMPPGHGHYPPGNMSSRPSAQAFAVELPDNQINSTPPMVNMQNHPSGQYHGQSFAQVGVPPKPHQPLTSPMNSDVPGPAPMRHTPTDPQFVSGPWASPPPTANHQYPPNRYNNPGGY